MFKIKSFTFGPFGENMYLLFDETGETIVFDPGCYDAKEEGELKRFIEENSLRPTQLINTHAHIDHILGNHFVSETYGLLPQMHQAELPVLARGKESALLYGLCYTESPDPSKLIHTSDIILLGENKFEIRLVPGHSPGSLVFINHDMKVVIGGDVLFLNSIGRTDLPGGDHQTLLDAIVREMYTLPGDYTVFPGHGPATTIGHEKQTNPFVRA